MGLKKRLPIALGTDARKVVVGLLLAFRCAGDKTNHVEGAVHADGVQGVGLVLGERADAGHLGQDLEFGKGPAGGEVFARHPDGSQGTSCVQLVIL